ncbi:hypothetical protein DH2020_027575 [Rehmannia glutinosa]|uniref:Uncharacterized protein n=1 Tax=Rehmannia glutinosa TaxID=99300 RepID=A0ABR0VXW1_REHGL
MSTGWIKSLQCKSKALDDVVEHHHHRRRRRDHHHSLSHSSSCKNSVQSLKDIVETTKPKKPKPTKPPQTPPFKRPVSRKPEPGSHQPPAIRTRSSSAESLFPSLTELPEGHPSRNVVEIIFHTSWGEKSFSGQVEMVFKVQNLTRTVTRFEEYREMVRSCVSSTDAAADGVEDHARCVADGNEVMRFYCLGATSGGGAYEAGCGAWALYGGKGAAVCTYSGSGCAHEKAGGGKGRRAMLVCRVIAGRVRKQLGFDSLLDSRAGFDSVSGEDGELLVFDSRALLPCFLIIYKL